QFNRVLKRNLEELQGSCFLKRKARAWPIARLLRSVAEFNSVPVEKSSHELSMFSRDALGQRTRSHPALIFDRKVFRNQNVNTIGLAIDMTIDPLQFEIQLVRGKGRGPEYPETAGTADRRHDVAAVTECNQGEVHAQHFTDAGFHAERSGDDQMRALKLCQPAALTSIQGKRSLCKAREEYKIISRAIASFYQF